MFSRGPTIVTVGGVPVRAEASWYLIILLLTWNFWSRFSLNHPSGEALAMGIVAALLFGFSVVAHEIAHALEARRRGVPVAGITMYLFGGATEILSEEVRRPGDEFALTLVGPWTSIALGALFGLISYAGAQAGSGVVSDVFGELGWLNILLGLFNLLPGAPLDGGRILTSIVWKVTGDRWKSMRAAARVGRAIGALLMALGVLELFVAGAGLIGGLWLILIGWFLLQAAVSEEFQANIEQGLADLPAGDLVTSPLVVPADLPLSQVIADQFRNHFVDAVLVGNGPGNGTPTGVLTLEDVERLPITGRGGTLVGAAARPLSRLPSVDANEPAAKALSQAAHGPVAVTRDGQLIGILTGPHLVAAGRRARDLQRSRRVARGPRT